MVHGPYLYLKLLICLCLLTACNNAVPIQKIETLEEAATQWQEVKPGSYSIDVERICFCPPPTRYTLFVSQGEIVKVVDTETGDIVEETAGYSTIDELFVWLQNIAKNDPQKLDLEFDETFGYPRYIDYNQSDNIADEEMLMRLQNFNAE